MYRYNPHTLNATTSSMTLPDPLLFGLPPMPLTQHEIDKHRPNKRQSAQPRQHRVDPSVQQVQLSPMWTLESALDQLRKSTEELQRPSVRIAPSRQARQRGETTASPFASVRIAPSRQARKRRKKPKPTRTVVSPSSASKDNTEESLPWLFETTQVVEVPSNGNMFFSHSLDSFVAEHMVASSDPDIRQRAQKLLSGTATCPITGERQSEEIAIVACCFAAFSSLALRQWLQKANVCPCCRKEQPEVVFFSAVKRTMLQALADVLLGARRAPVVVLKRKHCDFLRPTITSLGGTAKTPEVLEEDDIWHQHVLCFDDEDVIEAVYQQGKPETLSIIS
jgi:hypothetical protein